jgi:hypothetical protein
METNEQLVKMKPEEIGILETYKQGGASLGCSSMLGVAFAVIFISLRLFLPRTYWNSSIFVTIYMAALVVASLFVAFVIWAELGSRKSQINLVEQDLKEGYKKIIVRHVEKQNITGYEETRMTYGHSAIPSKTGNVIMSYNMLVDGMLFSADEELYMKLRVGDPIYFHVAPHSGSTLYYTIEADNRYYLPASLKRLKK